MAGTTTLDTKRSRADDPDALPASKLLAWSGAGMSGAANFIVLGYLSLYATDTLGIAPATIGVLILVSSIANVVGGLVASYIVDRSPETRFGKARPYELAVIGIWIATWALFSTPVGLSQTGRVAWIFVTFLAINTIFDTLLRSNDTLYMARAFPNRRVWAKVYTRAGIFTTIMGMILTFTLPVGLDWADKDPGRWSIVMGCVAVPLAVIGMTRFLFVKEEYGSRDDAAPKITVRDILSALRTGPWVWFIAGLFLLNSAVNGANMISYYFRYVVENLALQGVVQGAGIVALPLILTFPWLMKRFAISQIIIVGCSFGLLGSVFYFIADGNIPLLVVGAVLAGLAALPLSYLGGVMILDVCAFNEWSGKRRLESTMGAVTGVFGRIGMGLAGLFVGAVLGAAGYDGSADTQSSEALGAITGLFAGIPALAFSGIILLMVLYSRFDRRILPRVNADLDAERERATSDRQPETTDDET